jgi:hypothetical protein
MTFSPDASTAVLVYTNQRVVECLVKTGRFTQFSNTFSQRLPAEWTARRAPIRGEMFSYLWPYWRGLRKKKCCRSDSC